jgi:7-cyano-7-deazaguanine synthase
VSFDYGQRHKIELDVARRIAGILGVPHEQQIVLPIEALDIIGGAALTDRAVTVDVDAEGTGNKYAEEHDLPSTFVPGRNILFLGLASAVAAREGIQHLVTGICEADAAGYPDCRRAFRDAMEHTLRVGLDSPMHIHAPLLKKSKAETWKLAEELGVLSLIVTETHTCYHGDHETFHPWGFGCGECGACTERKNGWEEYRRPRATV